MCTLCCASIAQAGDKDWIAESNGHSAILLDVIAKYGPESASFLGVEGHDSEVFDLKPRFAERQEADFQQAIGRLQQARAGATDPRVRQDIDILIEAARNQAATSELNRRLMLPYFDLPQAIFSGFQNLLDARVPQDRQAHALLRLQRYAGTASGHEPITDLARARFEEKAGEGTLIGPWINEVEDHLDNQKRYVSGVRELFEKSRLKSWQRPLKASVARRTLSARGRRREKVGRKEVWQGCRERRFGKGAASHEGGFAGSSVARNRIVRDIAWQGREED